METPIDNKIDDIYRIETIFETSHTKHEKQKTFHNDSDILW